MSNTEITNPVETRYTEDEAAQKLGFKNRLTLWRWRRRGAIGYYKVGRKVWYGEHHLRDFMARCERGAEEVVR